MNDGADIVVAPRDAGVHLLLGKLQLVIAKLDAMSEEEVQRLVAQTSEQA